MPSWLLALLYLILTAGPVLVAAYWFPERRPFVDELASGLGIAAFSILLVEFALSGRFRTVSARIGIDVTMRFHQLFARTALVFIIVHPFLYRTPINRDFAWDPHGIETLGLGFPSFATGTLAWTLTVCLVLMAIWRDQLPYRYEAWRLMHGIGAALIVGLVAHHAWTAGRYSSRPPLEWIWLGLLAMAALTLVAVYVGRPLRRMARPYEVSSARKIAERTWELVIKAKGKRSAPFKAGQFVWLNIGHTPFSLFENPFSVASAPSDGPGMAFVIKEVGDFTRSLGSIPAGTRAHIDGPYGNLTIDNKHAKGIALVAGGVGIAPMLSILRQMRHDAEPRPAILLYGNRHRGQIVYEDELAAMAEGRQLSVIHVLSEPPPGWTGPTGVVDRATIEAAFGFEGAREWLYLLCGPPAMIEVAERALIGLGVPPSRILTERFVYD